MPNSSRIDGRVWRRAIVCRRGLAEREFEDHPFVSPELGRLAEDLERGVQGFGYGRTQGLWLGELDAVVPGREPGQVGEAVGQGVPVVAEPVGKVQRGREAREQGGLVGAAVQIDADVQLRVGAGGACWCAAFPAAFAVPEAGAVPAEAGCYCPRCLAELIEDRRARLAQGGRLPAASR